MEKGREREILGNVEEMKNIRERREKERIRDMEKKGIE